MVWYGKVRLGAVGLGLVWFGKAVKVRLGRVR